LYTRIDERMNSMIDSGLLEEAKALYPFKNLNALQTVGYREIFDYLDGQYDWEEAVRLLKRNTRRYAKRQLTWFKRDEDIKWFSPNDGAEFITHIHDSKSTLNLEH
jgi:tRNA dimethylallyltransferase